MWWTFVAGTVGAMSVEQDTQNYTNKGFHGKTRTAARNQILNDRRLQTDTWLVVMNNTNIIQPQAVSHYFNPVAYLLFHRKEERRLTDT